MKTYLVTYSGNASKFKHFKQEVNATSEREAVEKVYQTVLDQNYFPQDDGSIKDCDGFIVAGMGEDSIQYDGGQFSAEELKNDSVDQQKFIILIIYGQNSEYWNSYLVNDQNTTKNIEQAEGFDSLEIAEQTLETIVKPYCEKQRWVVGFDIEAF